MHSIISDAAAIGTAAQQLDAGLRAALPARIDCTVGGAGGSFAATVAYSPDLNLWYAAQHNGKTYWHGFGNGAPQAGKKVALASEINIPAAGVNRALSGALATDGAGRVWLLHRGKIRGGKALFFAHYSGATVTVADGGKEDTCALIGAVDDPAIAAHIARFVAEVARIKAAAKP
ncbi:restriction endonuclease [uncultured Cardiobacterium sp.]|uniref:restriction endonuclease n=1 Tax=uncultured Cardiobacterium sp. TaxID=417619 RepID=UPI0026193C68|nr:restriction endonuclease [uncultured Cardiobacterium sp.]